MRTVSETSETTLNAQTFKLYGGVPEEEKKKKGSEKIFEESIVENFLICEGKSHSSTGSAESPIQDKSKEKYAKTYINKTIKH